MLVNACKKTACLEPNRLALFFSIQFLQQSRVHAAKDFARGVVENQQESQKLAVDKLASEKGKFCAVSRPLSTIGCPLPLGFDLDADAAADCTSSFRLAQREST